MIAVKRFLVGKEKKKNPVPFMSDDQCPAGCD